MVTGEYPPMEGGVGAFTEQLAQALAALGHEVHVIVLQGLPTGRFLPASVCSGG
ncbi:MAG: glycogen/starch synthase [Chloroflexota bacterium]